MNLNIYLIYIYWCMCVWIFLLAYFYFAKILMFCLFSSLLCGAVWERENSFHREIVTHKKAIRWIIDARMMPRSSMQLKSPGRRPAGLCYYVLCCVLWRSRYYPLILLHKSTVLEKRWIYIHIFMYAHVCIKILSFEVRLLNKMIFDLKWSIKNFRRFQRIYDNLWKIDARIVFRSSMQLESLGRRLASRSPPGHCNPICCILTYMYI